MMAFDYSNSFANKKIPCFCCHKESIYQVQTNSFHHQIQCIDFSNHFLACAEIDCNYCVVNNKRAISYIKRPISSKKWKQSMSNTDTDPSIKESSSNNHTLICPLCDFWFDHSTSSTQKKSVEIKCINCNEMLLSWMSCAHMTTATSHGQKVEKTSML